MSSRRNVLQVAGFIELSVWRSPAVASAALDTAPKVAAWPGFEYLEPVYELKLAVDVLQASAGDPSKFPGITRD